MRLTGQSKTETKRLLDNVKSCIIELMRLRVPDDDEIYPTLKQARRDVQRLIMQADEYEAASVRSPPAERSGSSSPPHREGGGSPRESGNSLRYALAMRQLDCEISRLNSLSLIDVDQGSDVKPDILKDLSRLMYRMSGNLSTVQGMH